MIAIYKSDMTPQGGLKQITNIEPGSWINLVAPLEQELMLVSRKTGVPLEFLKAALDDEESSRIDIEDKVHLILVDIPFTEMEDNSLVYDTYPLAIIHTENELITVCLKNSKIITDFINGKMKSFFTFKKSRFILQLLQRVSMHFLLYLRQIDKKSVLIEKRLYKSMQNKELIQMLSLEKSLVYFNTSLKSNEVTLEKLLKLDLVNRYEEDQDLLDEVIIDNKQAIEMATIYSETITGTMDAFASVISNNVNAVMKFLAAVTIVMNIPAIIAGIYGMNVRNMPMADNPYGFGFVISIMLIATLLVSWFLKKRDMF
ncbi:magnesium transporter CorA family protein [Youngiibacter multivorans]|jgi:magnesium transporter|uniref:Magnesium transporter n=1 Tax=Youngiibacter multivorans TaxID=937251 RepID=A0ABS4G3B7_9CLOT|nr:magnesium transporter CorA family protein [Youngiibacter multivorans]MBP1919042.1 magnesium transporter [Youngiibacter multivorans]